MKMRRDENGFLTTCTPEDDAFIKANYLELPPQRMADIIGCSETKVKKRMRQLGLIVPRYIIERRIQESRIKKGSTPPNKGKKWDDYMSKEAQERSRKTTFKKGNLPHNCYHEIGKVVIRERESERYKMVCLAYGKWRLLHVVNWEKKYGKIPKGHCLWCKNGDTLNCDPDNWELITRAENLRRNRLTDSAIASNLARIRNGRRGYFVDESAKREYMKYPELLEMKRAQLLLNETIRAKKGK